jgi:neurofibromin 1
LWLAGVDPEEASNVFSRRGRHDVDTFKDDELLLITAMEMVDFQYLEDTVQARSLQWLSELSKAHPSVMIHLYVYDAGERDERYANRYGTDAVPCDLF